jgi:hypothetical protein
MSRHLKLVSLCIKSQVLDINVRRRPPPKPAATFELAFLGTILHVELPKHVDQQQLTETSSFGEVFDPMLHVSLLLHRFYLHTFL